MFAEYIWIDGTKPTKKLRSKTKVIPNDPLGDSSLYVSEPSLLPEWSYDGSSTGQAEGSRSDCVLKPVFACPDPIRGGEHILVLCEVFDTDGAPHPTNTRAQLREVIGIALEAKVPKGTLVGEKMGCWFGLEQEYTLFKGSRPLGFPENGFPAAQGPYYCGVGDDEVHGRPLVEKHLQACHDIGLRISGINAEVMPGQWEFQIGPCNPLQAGDHLWVARWLLYRIGEDFGISAKLNPKPVEGDWNGAGMHTNFSTPAMRTAPYTHRSAFRPIQGMEAIEAWCEEASRRVPEHLAAYGHGYEARLTGDHETCSFREFKWGVSDRTASVRIPVTTAKDGCGYLEDRRPNANADPYEVASVCLKTAFRMWYQ